MAIVPVTPERHGNRFWARFADFGFARGLDSLPLSRAELAEAAALYPIAFAGPVDAPEPRLILGLAQAGTNDFVTGDGQWVLPYIPAALRAYPFSARPAAQGQLALHVDEDSGLISGVPGNEAFFLPNGQPSPALHNVTQFLIRRSAEEHAARSAAAALAGAGLLIPLAPRGRLTAERAAGLWQVDPAALEALPDDRVLPLWQAGALGLAQAQVISLQHCSRQLRVAQAGTDGSTESARSSGADPGVSGFLDALAEAQHADAGFGYGPDGGTEE